MLARKLDRLFERYRTRDDGHALARVFDLVSSDLYRFALHLCRDGEAAEDLVQATFLAAIERRDSYVARGKLFSWLAGILGNEFRRRLRRDGRAVDPARLIDRPEADVVDAVAGHEAVERVQTALTGIPEPYRGVLELEINENLAAAAIAERLERPRGTVRAQLTRGRELLRRLLPPGLAGLFVTLFPRQSLAHVRGEVLTQAGFSASTGAASVATLKVVSGMAAVAVLAAAPLLVSGDAAGERDRRVVIEEEVADHATAPRRVPMRVDKGGAPEPFQEDGDSEAPQPGAAGHWRWRIGSLGAKGADGHRKLVELRVAEMPAGHAPKHFELKRSEPKLPYSPILDAVEFGPLTAVDVFDRGVTHLEGPPRDRLALVFFEGLEWGTLKPLTLENSMRPSSWYRRVVPYEKRILLSFGKTVAPSRPPRAVLLGRSGVVRKAFRLEGKVWVLDERVPLPLEVEFSLADGSAVTAMLRRGKARLTLRGVAKLSGARVQLVAAESGVPITNGAVRLCAPVIHGPSFPLVEIEAGAFAIPDHAPKLKGAAALVSAPGRLTQFVSLKRLGKGIPPIHTVPMLPIAARPGQLVEHDGTPLARARVRFRSTKWGHEMLEARSDADGHLEYVAVDFSRSGEGVRPTGLDTEVEGHVEAADGRRGRVEAITLRRLLDGAVLRLSEERVGVELVIVDAMGRPVPRAAVWVSLPGEHDGRLHAFHSTEHTTDDDGVCRIGAFFGDRIRALVSSGGRLREEFDVDVPPSGRVEIELTPSRPISVELVADVADLDLSDCTQVSISRSDGGGASYALESFGRDGSMSIEAPVGAVYTVTLALNHGSRHNGLVFVPEQREFEGVAPGAILRPRVTVCRGMQLDLVGAGEGMPRSAVVLLDGDSPPDERPWTHRTHGFGGSWRKGYPINLPLGSPTVTVVARGHRPRRVTLRVDRDGSVERVVRLEAGVTAAGALDGTAFPPGVSLELVAVAGVPLPPAWIRSLDAAKRRWVKIEADGTFRSEALMPGRYRVGAGAWEGAFDLDSDRSDIVFRRR